TIDYTGDYIYGDSETAMMKGAKSAMASTVMMWRSESNDLLQRMGDLRMATEEGGVWAKYYGGKYEMDAQKTKFNTSYSAYQVGYDKEVGDGWRVGLAVSHNDGNSTYDLGGKGDMTVTSLSVYGTKDYEDGRYLGLIVKGSSLKNEFEVYNNDGYKLEGDYKTWGTSLSAEYGKRIEKANGFYFDPSVELTIGHVQGKSYTASSDLLAAYGQESTMQVEQDSYNSVVGRIGFGIGQKLDKASYYAKLALAHEFAGDFETTYTAEETKGTSISFGDTWCEMQLGGTAKLSDNSLVYATYERSFGGYVTEKWRIDAGLRFSF
ncbi:MAG: autotransporter outer membrane beta-barrel domain-containing protein, partial [Phascolarctobacterium sp.]|nr:autotransporter outer membrane beta-barrel domain-containing protein [Phascolarctobacterium sp.]